MWIAISLLSAFFDSLKYVFGKKGATFSNPLLAGWAQWFFGLFLFIPLLFFADITLPGRLFWIIVLTNGILNTLASILFWKGLKIADISLAVPLVNFVPLFVLVFSLPLMGEFPPFWGGIGILIIVLGAYALNVNSDVKNIWQPLYSLYNSRGPRLVLLVAGIWGITSVLDKIAVQRSSPLIYVTSLYGITALFFTLLVVKRTNVQQLKKAIATLAPIGITSGLAHLTQVYALTLIFVSYVAAVKSTTVFFSLLWGWIIFKEHHILKRLLGTVIMTVGVLVLLFLG